MLKEELQSPDIVKQKKEIRVQSYFGKQIKQIDSKMGMVKQNSSTDKLHSLKKQSTINAAEMEIP